MVSSRRCLLVHTGVALLLAIVVLSPGTLRAQQTQLLYEKGGMFGGPKNVTVRLTGPRGQVPPDTAVTRSADRIHVLFRPVGDWTFSTDAPNVLGQVVLRQDSVRVEPESLSFRRQEGNVVAARVVYPRAPVGWFDPVSFAHGIDTSATMTLPEVYAKAYPRFRRPYDRGRRLLNEGHPLRALDTLSVFLGTVRPALSFVDRARDTLDRAAAAAVERRATTFRKLRSEVISTPNRSTLDRLAAFQRDLDSLRTALDAYLAARPEAGTSIQRRLKNLSTSAASLYEDAYETYRQQTVRVFIQRPYTRAKPSLFIEAVARLLLDPETALAAEGMRVDSLPVHALMEPAYADLRRTLRSEGWWREFQDVAAVVDKNLRRRDQVFGDTVFESLRLKRMSAAQPYYELLSALDAVAAGDSATYQERWERALTTCTDLSLLNAMQQWVLASRTAPGTVPQAVPALMADAERFRNNQRFKRARQRLERARRQAPRYAPLLYELGRIKRATGDTTAAKNDFARARTAAPRYVAPEVATLRLLLAQEQHETALRRADSTLQQHPYWLVYFPKARALVALDRYDKAINVLRGHCEQLNDQSYALYVVMAEMYAEQGAWNGVPWALQKAEALTPQRPAFVPRLLDVRERVRQTDEVSLDAGGSDPGAPGSDP